MPAPPAHVVDDAVRTLREDGPDAEALMLMLPYGLPHGQRAAMLDSVGDLCQAIRARGVPAKVMRIAGQDLMRWGIDAGEAVEALLIVHTGTPPGTPDAID